MTMARFIGLLAIVVALSGGISATAIAAESVAVRVGEHPGFSRLVFDWRGPVGVRLEQTPGRATVHFDRAAELDLTRYKADPPPGIADVSVAEAAPGMAVTVALADGFRARLLEVDGVVVVDVLQPGTPLDASPAKPGTTQPTRTAGAQESAGKAAVENTAPVEKTAAAKAGPAGSAADSTPPAALPPLRKPAQTAAAAPLEPVTVQPALPPPAPGEVVAVPIPPLTGQSRAAPTGGPISLLPPADTPSGDAAPKSGTGPEAEADGKSEPTPEAAVATAPVPKGRPLRQAPGLKPSQPEAVAEAPSENRKPAASPPTAKPPGVSSSGPAVLIDTATAPARSVDRGVAVPLRFDWSEEVAAAAYRRGASLWLAFDRPPPRDLTVDLARLAPQFGPYEQFAIGGGTLIRMAAPPVLVPLMRKDGAAWIVDLWSADRADGPGIEAVVDGAAQPPAVSFAVPDAGRVMSFEDPELGDRIIVVPVTGAGRGLMQSREFPQFRALETYQGLAIQPFSESTEVSLADGAARVLDTGGLVISYGASLAQLQSNVAEAPTGPRLLDPESWRRGGPDDFLTNKQALQTALTEAPPEQLGVARLTLARFYFGHGLSAESLGVLRLREADDPRLAMDPQARLMKGVGEFLTDDFDNAAKNLFDPSLEGEWEAQLWHAAFAAASHDWALAARRFARTEPLIGAYLHSIRTRLRLLAAEANLGIADTAAADRYLQQIRDDSPTRIEEAQVAFLVGRRLQLEGDIEDAVAMWERVLTSRHPASVTRARVALLDLGMEQGTVTPEQAVQELERLRFAWRGDRFEFALLQRLGNLYIAMQDYRPGLRALRQAASYFPGSERAQSVAQRMRDVFVDLYLGKAAGKLPPLRALAMYEEFKELTPPGAEGDQVVASLVDRLVEIDLLDRAAELLTAQVKYRLDGVAKARAGGRLAMIRLLDRSPGKAIEAIEFSAAPDLPSDLRRERRHLRVRALNQLGRYDSALSELGRDDDPEAWRLRADILWAKRDWTAAAAALGRLVPPAPAQDTPFAEAESRAVVDLAVALTLAGEGDKLLTLGKAYGEVMRTQPAGQTFALLIGDPQPGQSKSIAEELAQVAQVEAFMTSYRERLQQQQASVPQ